MTDRNAPGSPSLLAGERSDVIDRAIDEIVDGSVCVLAPFETETLRAVAAMSAVKNTWIAGMIRDYIEAWREDE